MNSVDLVLWVLASPILFVKWLLRLRRSWQFWRMAYTPRIVCRNCGATISLVGLWEVQLRIQLQGPLAPSMRMRITAAHGAML